MLDSKGANRGTLISLSDRPHNFYLYHRHALHQLPPRTHEKTGIGNYTYLHIPPTIHCGFDWTNLDVTPDIHRLYVEV